MDLLQSSTNALPVISKVHVTRQKILSYLAWSRLLYRRTCQRHIFAICM